MRNWHLKSQIIFIQGLSGMIVFSVLVVNMTLIQNQFLEHITQSQLIYIKNELNAYTTNLIDINERFFISALSRSKLSILNANYFYQYIRSRQISMKNAERCQSLFRDIYCYDILGNLDAGNPDIINFASGLNQFLELFPKRIYLASTTSDQTFIIRPEYPTFEYIPHKRPWYLNHFEKYQKFQFPLTEPYFFRDYGIQITYTHNLEYNQLDGVIGTDINMAGLSLLKEDINSISSYLVNDDGKLLISSYYNQKVDNITFLYNESLTGINYDHFLNMQKMIKNESVDWDCMNLEKAYCVFNGSTLKYIIRVRPLEEYFLYAKVDYQQVSGGFLALKMKFHQIKSEMFDLVLYLGCAFTVIATIIFLVTRVLLQQPLERLKSLLKQKNHNAKIMIQFQFLVRRTNMDCIKNLELAVFQLLQFRQQSRRDNQQAQSQQLVKYPKQELYLNMDFSSIQLDDKKSIINLLDLLKLVFENQKARIYQNQKKI